MPYTNLNDRLAKFTSVTSMESDTIRLSHMIVIVCSFLSCLSVGCSPRLPVSQPQPLESKAETEDTIAYYTQLMQSHPNSRKGRDAHLKIGVIFYDRLGDQERGIQIFEKLIDAYSTSPQGAEALWRLAMHDYERGNYESAQKYYLRFLLDFSGNKRSRGARLRMADCLFHLGRYKDAIKAYADYEVRYPNDSRIPAVLLKIGEIHAESLNSPEQANVLYRRVIDDYPDATKEMAIARQRLAVPGGLVLVPAQAEADLAISEGEAIAIRQVGPKTRPNASRELTRWSVSAIFGYHPRQLLRESGLLDGEEMQESLAENGALLDDAVYNIGIMFYMSEDYKRAGTCLEKAVDLGIHEPNLYLKLGVCYQKIGAKDKAKQTFRQLASVDLTAFEKLVVTSEQTLANRNYRAAIESLEILSGVSERHDARIAQALDIAYRQMNKRSNNTNHQEKNDGK